MEKDKGLAGLIYDRARLRDQISELKKSYEDELGRLNARLKDVQTKISMSNESLDLDKIALAEKIIFASGDYGPHGDDQAAVDRAIEDLAEGCCRTGYNRLRTEYFGTKNFDHWFHQGSNHPYGYGPRHGSIVFRVGLTDETRKNLDGGDWLSDQEKDAAIYYLMNLSKIKQAKANA